jgi:hypothetical protein
MKPSEGASAIRSLVDRLADPSEIERAFVEAGVSAAQRAAGLRPHPQSALAAATLSGSGSRISVSSELFWGSERGSTVYRQFHGRTERGSWLFPSLDQPETLSEAERALQETLDSVA